MDVVRRLGLRYLAEKILRWGIFDGRGLCRERTKLVFMKSIRRNTIFNQQTICTRNGERHL